MEQEYLKLLKTVLEFGEERSDRTGVGTKSIFGYQMRCDLSEGFPLLTTKCIPMRLITSELLWFLRGDTNIQYLLKHNNHIWDEWAFENYINSEDYSGPDMTDFGLRAEQDEAFKKLYQQELNLFLKQVLENEAFAKKYGDLGPVYGKQWRNFNGVDQIENLINGLKNNPNSRRHILSAWNPAEIDEMALPPCHILSQFYVSDGKLSCQLYQRSGDIFLGIPFNIASYSLLTHLLAREVGLDVGDFVHTIGDAHLYLNHLDQAKEQLGREPRALPKLDILSDRGIFELEPHDIRVTGYDPHGRIKAEVAV